ncbi:hypothetical protein [Variovorax paradoxus]|uniref:hypothetical protein n=1 Tax=Variovorax paradoxus TaxID=34073 RepID=UPI003D658B18
MPWGAAIGAIGGIISADKQSGGGGGGSQQSSSEPWMMAQPWMLQNIMQGQSLQNQYTAKPFSAQQEAAYDNSYALNDYVRELVPGLLGQLGGQQVGFDKTKPNARPDAWNWSGLLSDNAPDLGQQSVRNARPAAAPADAPAKQGGGDFLQQEEVLNGANMSSFDGQTMLGGGGYGSFRYGMDVKPGTKEYRDMSEYFAMGGLDPNDQYGRGAQYKNPKAHPLAHLWTSGVGGTPAGGGIGDTGANAAASASGNTAW